MRTCNLVEHGAGFNNLMAELRDLKSNCDWTPRIFVTAGRAVAVPAGTSRSKTNVMCISRAKIHENVQAMVGEIGS